MLVRINTRFAKGISKEKNKKTTTKLNFITKRYKQFRIINTKQSF